MKKITYKWYEKPGLLIFICFLINLLFFEKIKSLIGYEVLFDIGKVSTYLASNGILLLALLLISVLEGFLTLTVINLWIVEAIKRIKNKKKNK